MDLELTDEQLELREMAAGALDRHAPLSLARDFLDGRGDAQPLADAIAALGWLGIGLDDDDPFGVPGLCLLASEAGRRAAPTVLAETAAVARIAHAVGHPQAEAIADGTVRVSIALLEPGRDWAPDSCTTTLGDDGGLVLDGRKIGVPHGATVDRLAVVATRDGRPVLVLVDRTADGVETAVQEGLDPASAPARVELDGVAVAAEDVLDDPDALEHALAVAAIATMAEALGAAEAALDMAVAYALEREQYGHVIGSYQAIKHLLAEHYALRETAWATTLYASAALEERTADAALAVATARAHGAHVAKAVVEAALQAFGGVGVTREHDLHLVYRRALEASERFGGAREHERRIAATLLTPEPALVAGR